MTPRGFTPPLPVLRLRHHLDRLEHHRCPGRPVHGHAWVAAAEGVLCRFCDIQVTERGPSWPDRRPEQGALHG